MADDKKLLRVGIVGCGRIAEHHARWIKRAEGAVLSAVADARKEVALSFAEKFGVAASFGSLGDMLSAKVVDVVHITTPPSFHYTQACEAIDAGVHALVEKPFTLSAAEALDLYKRAEEKDVKLTADFIQLFHPAFQQLAQAIRTGRIGRVVWAHVYFGVDLKIDELRNAWPVHWTYSLPGGVLHSYITHPLYMLCSVLDGPYTVEVIARSTGTQPQGTTDQLDIQITGPSASANLILASTQAEAYYLSVRGTRGAVSANFTTHAFVADTPIAGPQAVSRLLANPQTAWQLLRQTASLVWRVARRKMLPYQGLGPLLEGFYGSIKGGAAPITMDLVLAVAKLEEQIVARSGPVKLSNVTRPGTQHNASKQPAVLVTGATGYLGRAVVRQLVGAGYRVRVLARPTSVTDELERLGVEIVFGDLRDQHALHAAVGGVRFVVNLAAGLWGSAEGMLRTAVDGTKNLADAARAANVDRVIYIGSVSIYQFLASTKVIDENSPLEPEPARRGASSAAKVAAEHIAMEQLRAANGPAWTIIRPSLLVGRERNPFDPLGIRVGRFVVSFGRGGRLLRLIHVDDVATAILRVLHTDGTRGRIYTLSHPDTLTARQYVREVLKPQGHRLTVVHLPYTIAAALAFLANTASRIRGKGLSVDPVRLRYLFASPRVEAKRLFEAIDWAPTASIQRQLLNEGVADK
jgi:2-alkyl-3-oxoalkanoate reductase